MITSSPSTARRRARELRYAKQIRDKVAERDGCCRVAAVSCYVDSIGQCQGPMTWAHLDARRRSKTRRMKPEDRHDTAHTLILCQRHHDAYDQHTLDIEPESDRGADGPLRFVARGPSEAR